MVANRREQVVIKRRASDQEGRNVGIVKFLLALDLIERKEQVINWDVRDQVAVGIGIGASCRHPENLQVSVLTTSKDQRHISLSGFWRTCRRRSRESCRIEDVDRRAKAVIERRGSDQQGRNAGILKVLLVARFDREGRADQLSG
jgi:hypothetical protein